jgi:hypothetical protein
MGSGETRTERVIAVAVRRSGRHCRHVSDLKVASGHDRALPGAKGSPSTAARRMSAADSPIVKVARRPFRNRGTRAPLEPNLAAVGPADRPTSLEVCRAEWAISQIDLEIHRCAHRTGRNARRRAGRESRSVSHRKTAPDRTLVGTGPAAGVRVLSNACHCW